MDSGVAKVGLPSSTAMARPVLLGFLDPKNEGYKFNRKRNSSLDTSMAKPTPKHLLRIVEREVHLECLGASVERCLKKRWDYNVKVAFRGFLLVFSWKFLTPIQLKLCKTQSGCRYRAL